METKHQELMMDLSLEEMMEVHGGELPKWIKVLGKKFVPLGIGVELWNHWSEFEEGFVSGWNAVVKPQKN